MVAPVVKISDLRALIDLKLKTMCVIMLVQLLQLRPLVNQIIIYGLTQKLFLFMEWK